MTLNISQLDYYNDKGKVISAKFKNGTFPLAEFITAINTNVLVSCTGHYEDREFMLLKAKNGKFFFCADVRETFRKGQKKTALIAFQEVILEHELLTARAQIENNMVTSGLKLQKELYLSVNEESQEVHLSQSV